MVWKVALLLPRKHGTQQQSTVVPSTVDAGRGGPLCVLQEPRVVLGREGVRVLSFQPRPGG